MESAPKRTRINDYLKQIKEEYEGEGWYGDSYLEKLKNLEEDVAFLQPVPGNHSVAEILAHVIYWRTVVIKRIEGDREYRDRTMEKMNFVPVEELRRQGWKTLFDSFRDSQSVLIAVLESNDDSLLDRVYNDEHGFDYMVEGIIHHDLYHLGQIGFVLAILNDKR